MANRLSVLHFIRRVRAEDGGVVQTVLDLCQTIAAAGHNVTLATTDATDVPQQWRDYGAETPQVLELGPTTFANRLSRHSLGLIESKLGEIEVAHLHTPWELANVQLADAFRKASIPYIVTAHGMLDDWCMIQKPLKKKIYLSLFAKRLFGKASVVHFTAEAERDQALKYVPAGGGPAIQACAMDLSPYENLPGRQPALDAFPQINSERQSILFLSRIHPKKGIEILLRAGAELKARGTPPQILIAGPGEESYINELKSLGQELGLERDVHFLGMVRGETKLSLYQLADVFVLPTYQENFGLVLPEAMASGTAVVTTRGTDIWRELEQAGAKIVGNEPSDIAGAIQEFLTDEEHRKASAERGQQFVAEWLGAENVAAGYENLYHTALERGPIS